MDKTLGSLGAAVPRTDRVSPNKPNGVVDIMDILNKDMKGVIDMVSLHKTLMCIMEEDMVLLDITTHSSRNR